MTARRERFEEVEHQKEKNEYFSLLSSFVVFRGEIEFFRLSGFA